MKGSALIEITENNTTVWKDIFTECKVSFIKGSYAELLTAYTAKDYVTNNSELENGVRYLFPSSGIKLTEKTSTVQVLIEGNSLTEVDNNCKSFVELMFGRIFKLKLPHRNVILKLVYKSIKQQGEYRNNKAIFVLELVEPNPADRTVA